MKIVTKNCFICGKESWVSLPDDIASMYNRYLNGEGYIQDIPLCANVREFLKTGMCQTCQNDFFGQSEVDPNVQIHQ